MVTDTPRATSVSASSPLAELPTAMTSQGRKAVKLLARRSKPSACAGGAATRRHDGVV